MKKIAVISSFGFIKIANNYGALLQYYALQQYLYNKGHYVFWIRYLLNTSKFVMVKMGVKQLLKNPILSICSLFCHKSFLNFCHDYLNLSNDSYSLKKLNDTYPLADYYITGSDQVWGGVDPANYLTFVDNDDKKIAYAASFGKDYIESIQSETIRPWIKSFKHISVREKSGVDICNSLGVSAVHLLDPTFLISVDRYPHLNDKKYKANFIFCYFLNFESTKSIRWDEIKNFAHGKEMTLKVCAVQGTQYKFKFKNLVFPSPIEWLTYYRDAEFIITNTFHGTVFAIIHHKPFVCILQTGSSAKQNTRLISLLSMLNLSDRVLNSTNTFELIFNKIIDWEYVEQILDEWRKKTDDFFEFLK